MTEHLTPRERIVYELLRANPDRVVTYAEFGKALDCPFAVEPLVKTYVCNVRRKLGVVVNVQRGRGYSMGRTLPLSPNEMTVYELLRDNPGRPISYAEFGKALGIEFYPNDIVRNTCERLRRKLGIVISFRREVGYQLGVRKCLCGCGMAVARRGNRSFPRYVPGHQHRRAALGQSPTVQGVPSGT